MTVDDPSVSLGPRETLVLAALAIKAGEALSADQLAEVVWHDDPPASWHKNLQGCVVRLRKALGPGVIETSARGYRLVLPPDEVDVRRFESLVARGRELLTLNEPERAAYTLGQALALWRGRPLAELEDWEPGALEAARLGELRLDAQEWWLDAAIRAGHHREVLIEAQAMVGAAPLRERRWQLLALAQYRAGRQGEALRTLQEVRRLLAEELGLDPGPELEALQHAILRHDPDLAGDATRSHASEACPYLGLRSYDVDDGDGFFGRERDVAACLDRLEREGVLAVLGPSGSGKSSLVRAGLVASLVRSGRRAVVITPGAHPLTSFPAPHPGTRAYVLVVDQAEEVFSLCGDPEERTAFLHLLAEHAAIGPLVLALRADRMGDVSAHPAFARLVERGLYVLGAMPAAQLCSAVEEPARQAGLVIEPGLVDLLVREVEGEPGALPLLSHALRETWLRREGRTLTVAGYQASGGIRGAVAQSAEHVYGRLDPDQRRVLRDLLLRLVSLGAEGEPVRSRVPRRQLVADPEHARLVDLLIASRLVTSHDRVVELAHEALAREWPRLRGWLEDDIEGQRILHHLTTTTDAWDALGRPPSELYRGVRLARALEWRGRPHAALTAAENEFLDASRALAEAEERETAERARGQARLIRRLRIVLAGAMALLVAALAAGGVAVHQQNVADANAATAVAAQTSADARRAGARALAADDIGVSLLLAVAGARLDDTQATLANLLGTLSRRPQLIRSIPYVGDAISGLELSPDGRTLAVYDNHGGVVTYDTRTWRSLATFGPPASETSRERVAPLAWSPDGGSLAVGMPLLAPDPLRLLDADTLRPRGRALPGLGAAGRAGRDRTLSVSFSADGTRLAATFQRLRVVRDGSESWWAAPSSMLVVWDLTPNRPRVVLRRALPGRTYQPRDRNLVSLSPDGRTVYTSKPLTAYDVDTGRKLYDTGRPAFAMALSPDGRTLAIDRGSDVLLLDAATRRVEHTLRGHTEPVSAVRFSTDGRLLVSSAEDKTAIVWDVASATLRERFDLGVRAVPGLSFDKGGHTVFTGGADRAIRSWDLDGGRRFLSEIRNPRQFGFGWVIPSPGGQYTAHSYAEAGNNRFFSTSTGRASRPFGRASYVGGAFTRSGDRFAGASANWVEVRDPRTGRLLADDKDRPLPHDVVDLAYSPDSRRLFVSDTSGAVTMLDADTLDPVAPPVDVAAWVCCTSAASDDRTALVLTPDTSPTIANSFEFTVPMREWVLVDAASGRVVRRGNPGFDMWWSAALSPTADRLAIGGAQGQVALVDSHSGKPVRPPVVAHSVGVAFVFWSADGSRFLTTSGDGSVALWDGRTGELMGRVVIPEGIIASAQFMTDDRILIAPYTDSAYVWDTSRQHAVEVACAMAGRGFTEAEWREWFSDRPYQPTCPGR